MTHKEDLAKASQYYILHSQDYRINIILALIFCGLFCAGVYSFNLFPGDQGGDIILLLVWVLMLGIGLLFGNSMVIDLTVKDKLSRRLEFILASGIQVKDLVIAYSFQMCRFSMIIPFILLMAFVYLPIFDFSFMYIVLLFFSTTALVFTLILYFNLLAIEQKHLKFFKYLLFAAVNLLIYFLGSFSDVFLNFLQDHQIPLAYFILGLNGLLLVIFAFLSYFKLSKLTNERVIRQEGTWS
ncbi:MULTISPECIES: hypothetical protein [Aerococcus]|uniref:Uncharacterized protein n=2 Tax=Aerococcus TaxID=1375 RepID=A0A178HEH1_9LACT|nr:MULTISPECIES: hypothetical protein [Aerococcus]KAA9220404.1 hypothetical protein F6I39_01615 [Aerococcus loyolae]KAA9265536.1 hypothetical protein F6I19_04155 [Aerococcus loyolae]MCY3026317.1 hypothetical protein [Aerococcus loyolae]MCY3027249.1 hypothetical protein [Aerococcus loyolae]MCY3028871.1 hypothetical protein [Aerococcus loyolae]